MHIGHVALRTPDLDRHADYLIACLGLQTTSRDDRQVLLTANEKHHEVQLLAADRAALDHVGLEVETDEELESVYERALGAGARPVPTEETEPGLTRALRLQGPGNIVYELYTRDWPEPDGLAHLRPGIRRLGHLTFVSDIPAEIVEFWIKGLGFLISDEIEGFTWLRCDPDHHGFAVGTRPGPTTLHHHAWEVQDFSALGQYLDSIATDGRRILWGPVRHGPGFNLATYQEDPDGGVVEVYSDLLRIADDENYRPVDWSEEPDALNLWGGPEPPERLIAAGLPAAAALTDSAEGLA